MRILIVDDSAFARRKARQLLEELGHTVTETDSGAGAIASIVRDSFDAVMLDLVMDGMGGLEVLARLREMAPSLHYVVATADTQESTAAAVRTAGARAILNKPLSAEALKGAFALPGPRRLTPDQTDAIAELVNIGYGRAASALSAMTKERILLEPPVLTITPVAELGEALAPIGTELVCVNQSFSGAVNGSVMLLLDPPSAEILRGLVDEVADGETPLSVSEVISEVGNVLLNAVLGVFGNVLCVQVSFQIPLLTIQAASELMRSVMVGNQQVQHTILVRTRFSLQTSRVPGFLVILLGVASLDRLLEALNKRK